MEGKPPQPEHLRMIKNPDETRTRLLTDIEAVKKGRPLADLSISELTMVRDKYIALKQALGIPAGETASERKEGKTSYERAKEIMGINFFGVNQVEKAFDSDDIPLGEVPAIPYGETELEQAKEQGYMLVLRLSKDGAGNPMSMKHIHDLASALFSAEEDGELLHSIDWYKDEDFFTDDPLKTEWKLVGTGFVPGSTSKNYIEQTKVLRDHLFSQGAITEEEKAECADEILDRIEELRKTDWKAAAKQLAELSINQQHRRSPAEILYDWVVRYRTTKGEDRRGILENNYDWSNRLTSDGDLVRVGDVGAAGAFVHRNYPDDSVVFLGVVPVR